VGRAARRNRKKRPKKRENKYKVEGKRIKGRKVGVCYWTTQGEGWKRKKSKKERKVDGLV
jgi:hypothetical protein